MTAVFNGSAFNTVAFNGASAVLLPATRRPRYASKWFPGLTDRRFR